MSASNELSNGHTSTTVVAILTIVVTAVAAIPGFLGLNKELSQIYYSDVASGIAVPDSADEPKIRSILASNNIASDQLSISMVNQGNKEAAEVRVSVSVPGKVLSAWTDPPEANKPIWVQLPDMSQIKGQERFQIAVKALAITKPLTIYVGFERTRAGAAGVEVFAEGRPAAKVQDVAAVPAWSPIEVFRLPLIILGVGLALVVIWAMGVVLSNNPKMKSVLSELAVKSIAEFMKAMYPFGR